MNNNLIFRTLFLALFLSQSALFFAQDAAPSQIDFIQNDFSLAKAQAKESNKLILVKFTAKWCMPCKVMDEFVWTDPCLVGTTSQNCVALSADYDHIDVYEVRKVYNIEVIPTILILDASGKELIRLTSACTASEIEAEIDSYKTVENRISLSKPTFVAVDTKAILLKSPPERPSQAKKTNPTAYRVSQPIVRQGQQQVTFTAPVLYDYVMAFGDLGLPLH